MSTTDTTKNDASARGDILFLLSPPMIFAALVIVLSHGFQPWSTTLLQAGGMFIVIALLEAVLIALMANLG